MVSIHSPGKGRGLTPYFSFAQKNLARSSSTSSARIWVPEEPKQPWWSFSSSDSFFWLSRWFSPSHCALQGSGWHIRKSSPVRSPRMLCDLLVFLSRENGPRLVHQGSLTDTVPGSGSDPLEHIQSNLLLFIYFKGAVNNPQDKTEKRKSGHDWENWPSLFSEGVRWSGKTLWKISLFSSFHNS